MRKKFNICLLLIFVFVILMIISALAKQMILFWVFFALIMLTCAVMLYLQVKKIEWKCKKCGNILNPSAAQVIFGINGGDIKKLYCPHCNKKCWCEPIDKETSKKI